MPLTEAEFFALSDAERDAKITELAVEPPSPFDVAVATPEAYEDPDENIFEAAGRGTKRGIYAIPGTIAGVTALAADQGAFGEWGKENAPAMMAEAGKYFEKGAQAGPQRQLDEVSDPGQLVTYIAGQAAAMIPDMLLTGSMGKVAASGTKAAVKEAIKRGLMRDIEKNVALGATKEAAEKMAAEALEMKLRDPNTLKKLAAIGNKTDWTSFGAVQAGTSVARETANIASDIFTETGEIDTEAALKYGIPAGMLDAVGDTFFGGKLFGVGEVADKAFPTLASKARKVLSTGAKAGATELPTEVAQEGLAIAAMKDSTDDWSWNEEDTKRLFEAAVAGGGVGFLLGLGGGTADVMRAPKEDSEVEKKVAKEVIKTGKKIETTKGIAEAAADTAKNVTMATGAPTGATQAALDMIANKTVIDDEDALEAAAIEAAKKGAEKAPETPALPVAEKAPATENKEPVAEEEKAPVPTYQLEGKDKQPSDVVEVPIENISLSEDVPQFKRGADKQGITEPLGGNFQKNPKKPIVLFQRNNGKLEVATGRHRFELAQREGEKTMTAQIYKEADGYTPADMMKIDAMDNIRDGKGTALDYATYIRNTPNVDEATLMNEGVLSSAKGRAGFSLGRLAGEDLFDAVVNGKISETKAANIAAAAPLDDGLQRAAMARAATMSHEQMLGFVESMKRMKTPDAIQTDLFGADDAALVAADQISREAVNRVKKLNERINAVRGAATNPKIASEEGVDVRDEAALNKRISELESQRDKLKEHWLHPEIQKELEAKFQAPVIEEAPKAAVPTIEETGEGNLFPEAELPFNLAGEVEAPVATKVEEKTDEATSDMFGEDTAKRGEKAKMSKDIANAEAAGIIKRANAQKTDNESLATIRKEIAESKNPDTLAVLAQNESTVIKAAVAANPNTRPETLVELAKGKVSNPAYFALINNPNTPADLKAELEANPGGRSFSAETEAKPELTPELVSRLAALPTEKRIFPFGDYNDGLRRDVVKALTGKAKVTKKEASPTKVRQLLTEYYGSEAAAEKAINAAAPQKSITKEPATKKDGGHSSRMAQVIEKLSSLYPGRNIRIKQTLDSLPTGAVPAGQGAGSIARVNSVGYSPGETSITRSKESTIMTFIHGGGWIQKGDKVLHAGAGEKNNPDRKALDELAETTHYDPQHEDESDTDVLRNKDKDVVVSPFVLNVLDGQDRRVPIADMVLSLKPDGIAVVAVRGTKDVDRKAKTKSEWVQWSDGWLTPKSGGVTFQKGFTADELAATLAQHFESVEIVNDSNEVPVVVAKGPKYDSVDPEASIDLGVGRASTKFSIGNNVSKRFYELTSNLPKNLNVLTLSTWIGENPEKYKELKALKESVLLSQGYTRKAYHGTKSSRFTVFNNKRSKRRTTNAPDGTIFLADNKAAAASYDPDNNEGHVMELMVNLGNTPTGDDMGGAHWEGGRPGEVMVAYPDTGKREVFDDLGSAESYLSEKYPNEDPEDFITEYIPSTNQMASDAINDGSSSVTIENVVDYGSDYGNTNKPYTVTVVFDSNQVKSTEPLELDADEELITPNLWGNQKNPDIRYAQDTKSVEAYYDPATDEMVFVTDNISDEQRAAQLFFHEATHGNMARAELNPTARKELNDILQLSKTALDAGAESLAKEAGFDSVEAMAEEYGYDLETENGRGLMRGELVARFAERMAKRPEKPAWWQSLLYQIKRWVQRTFNVNMNLNDLEQFLRYKMAETPAMNAGVRPIRLEPSFAKKAVNALIREAKGKDSVDLAKMEEKLTTASESDPQVEPLLEAVRDELHERSLLADRQDASGKVIIDNNWLMRAASGPRGNLDPTLAASMLRNRLRDKATYVQKGKKPTPVAIVSDFNIILSTGKEITLSKFITSDDTIETTGIPVVPEADKEPATPPTRSDEGLQREGVIPGNRDELYNTEPEPDLKDTVGWFIRNKFLAPVFGENAAAKMTKSTPAAYNYGGFFGSFNIPPQVREFLNSKNDFVASKASQVGHLTKRFQEAVKKAFPEGQTDEVNRLLNAALGNIPMAITKGQQAQATQAGRLAFIAAQDAYIQDNFPLLAPTLAGMKTFAQRNSFLRKTLKESAFATMMTEAKDAQWKGREKALGAARQLNAVAAAQQKAKALEALPHEVADALTDMRIAVDELIAYGVNNKLLDEKWVSAMGNNEGVYLTRTYRIKDDPKWKNKVRKNKEIMDRLADWAEQSLIQSKTNEILAADQEDAYKSSLTNTSREPISRAEAKNRAIGELSMTDLTKAIDSILNAAGNEDAVIEATKEFAPDMAAMGIPQEIREAWGEYMNPEIGFARTLSRAAQTIATNQFFQDMLNDGIERGYIKTKETVAGPGEATFKKTDGPVAVFNGYVAPKQFVDWLTNYYDRDNRNLGELMKAGEFGAIAHRGLATASLITTLTKTIGSPITGAARNFVSNIPIAIVNGDLTQGNVKEAYKTVIANLRGKSTKEREAFIRDLIERGVLSDNVGPRLIHELMEASRLKSDMELDTWLTKQIFDKSSKLNAIGTWNTTVDGLSKWYGAMDEFWKVNGYFAEQKRITQHEKYLASKNKDYVPMTQEQKDQQSADYVREVYPTYSMAPGFIRAMKTIPVLGQFATFSAEMIRTTYNSIARHLKNAKSKDQWLANQGKMGLARTAAVVTAPLVLSSISKALLGISDEEEEALRQSLPPWQRDAQLIFLGRGENGKLQFMDVSYVDPYAFMKAPFMAAMHELAGGDSNMFQVAGAAIASVVEPFVGVDIATQKAMEVFNNKTASGGRVYNPEEGLNEVIKAGAAHMWKGVKPGIVTTGETLYKGISGEKELGEAIANVVGAKVQTSDPVEALRFATWRTRERLQNANAILIKAVNTGEDPAGAAERTNEARYRIMRDVWLQYNAAITRGASDTEAQKILKDLGVSKEIIRQVRGGYINPYVPGKRSLKNATPEALEEMNSAETERRYFDEEAQR